MTNHLFSESYQSSVTNGVGAKLILSVENTTDGLEGALEYNSALFASSTVKQMADHFQTLLNGIISNPQQKVAQIPILSEAERNKIIFDWNNTYAAYPEDKCIDELFEKQVNCSPDAVAVMLYNQESKIFSKKEQLTYSELNKRANQLTHYLRRLGVGPDVLVGIYMKRSFEMVVAVLGILKAGGAYLPLDTGHPKERLKFMLEDSRILILLSQHQLLHKLPPCETHVIS